MAVRFQTVSPKHVMTGGARGFDDWVGGVCKEFRVTNLICIPPCSPRAKELIPLTKAQLRSGGELIHRASLSLHRVIPTGPPLSYLQATAHQVAFAKQVLVFGHREDKNFRVLKGHNSCWGAQMAIDRNVPLFLFDLDYMEWLYWDNTTQTFRQCEGMSEQWVCKPSLVDMTCIIGDIGTPPVVTHALRDLFNNYNPLHVSFA